MMPTFRVVSRAEWLEARRAHLAREKELKEANTRAIHAADLRRRARQYLASAPLHLTATASSVRLRAGQQLVTDGPFAETREQLGGYFLIDAKNKDEAIAIAARIPMARRGTVEVRQVMEIPGLAAERSER